MLIIRRSEGESIKVIVKSQDNRAPVVITVTYVGKNTIGFEAPRDIAIIREELLK